MNFKLWLEQENMYLRGEYWIEENGEVMADMEYGDYNHEGYVMDRIQREIANEFNIWINDEFVDWDKIKQKIVQSILDDENEQTRINFKNLIEKEGEDTVILMKMKETDPQAEEKLNLANGSGDAREYAIMRWGWKTIRGNNIESASLTSHDMQIIANGIYNIDEMMSPQAEFSVSVYGGKNYDVTLAELEAGKFSNDEPQQAGEQQRRQTDWQNKALTNAASKQIRDMELKKLDPYYQKRTFPFGDSTIN